MRYIPSSSINLCFPLLPLFTVCWFVAVVMWITHHWLNAVADERVDEGVVVRGAVSAGTVAGTLGQDSRPRYGEPVEIQLKHMEYKYRGGKLPPCSKCGKRGTKHYLHCLQHFDVICVLVVRVTGHVSVGHGRSRMVEHVPNAGRFI